jgi:hypothetical protein
MFSEQGISVDGCWAAPLCECGGKLTREHVVSECLFNDEDIDVKGFPWCVDKAKRIRPERLTAKILCQKHNSESSNLDATALKAFDAFRESVRLTDIRGKLPNTRWTFKHMKIDGPKLERWFLKTLMNMSVGGKWIIGPGDYAPGVVPKYLAEVAFGKREFEQGAGMYVAGRKGDTILSQDGVSITAKTFGQNLVGATFNFRGYTFYLNLLAQSPQFAYGAPLIYRSAKLRYQIGKRESHRITLVWPSVSAIPIGLIEA